jgi:DNA polymerase III delta prime subunit
MSFLTVQKARQKHGCHGSSQSLHFLFTGNPGTGKTTVAVLLGRILFGFGFLPSPKVVECDGGKLLGKSPSETAAKTDAIIKSASGGVLIVHELYLLASGRGPLAGAHCDEAMAALFRRMANEREPLVVIIAGRPAPMESFLAANPDVKERFARSLSFDDYAVADLCRIFERICVENEYSLTPNARAYAFLHFSLVRQRHEGPFENARAVRNSYESALSFQEERLAARSVPASQEQARQLEGVDIVTSSVYETELRAIDLSSSKWDAECPDCHRPMQAGVANLGKRISCKCGGSFIFPWWNPVRSSIPKLSDQFVKLG